MKNILLCLPLLLLAACATNQTSKPASATSGAPATFAVTPSPKSPSAQEPGFRFEWEDRSFRFYEAKSTGHDVPDLYAFGPYLELTVGREKRALDLRPNFTTYYITHVFQDSESRRIWVVMEKGIEGPGDTYTLWISEDGGDRWFRGGDIPRPPGVFPYGELSTLVVDYRGQATAWLRVGSEPGQEGRQGSEALYRVESKDGGRSWTSDNRILYWNSMTEQSRGQR